MRAPLFCQTLSRAVLIVLLCALTGVGCIDVVTFEYEEFVQPLDDDAEFVLSTYPAWYPRESVDLAPVYVRLRQDDYVALKIHVRARKGSGNAGAQSVYVHRLAYCLDGEPETVVLTDYRDGFWMQQTGAYGDRKTNGIRFQERSVLHFSADLTVNGERFSIAGHTPARRRFNRYPIVLHYLGP